MITYWEWLNLKETVFSLLADYGYYALYSLLALGIIGLPIPDETLMAFVGSMTMHGGPMNFWASLAVAYAGTMTGMTISYTVGRKVGKPFLYKYGKWMKLTPARLQKAENWFRKYGLWTVGFGYFVPGVRHFTCYLAGMSGVKWWKYLLYAGSGALVWCVTFLLLGRWIGRNFDRVLHMFHRYTGVTLGILGGLLLILGLIVYLVFKRKKKQRNHM
ncbi:DedA family protein [Paenibacillus larvae]